MVGDALQRTCSRVCNMLRDSLGDDGTTALLSRALARTESHHPALKEIRRINGNGIELDGVTRAVETTSVAEVTAAIEALLGALVDVLGRLIGDEMALRIIDSEMGTQNGGRAPGS